MFQLNQQQYPDFQSLVLAMPEATFASPRRSTVPLLDYWRDPSNRLPEFTSMLGLPFLDGAALSFEYQVSVKAGHGKPSCTDLMIIVQNAAVAVEAKFTEPRYEMTSDWLKKGNQGNRKKVLTGWLAYIHDGVGMDLQAVTVGDIPYQLLHRFASLCSVPAKNRYLLYQLFGSKSVSYRAKLEKIHSRLPHNCGVRLFEMVCPFDPTVAYQGLMDDWKQSHRDGMSTKVRRDLSDVAFCRFHSPVVHEVGIST